MLPKVLAIKAEVLNAVGVNGSYDETLRAPMMTEGMTFRSCTKGRVNGACLETK